MPLHGSILDRLSGAHPNRLPFAPLHLLRGRDASGASPNSCQDKRRWTWSRKQEEARRRKTKREKARANSVRAAEEMFDGMRAWRKTQLQAAFNESAGRSAHLHRVLMSETLGKLLSQLGDGRYEEVIGPQRGRKTKSNGRRTLLHAEKEVKVKPAHRLCPDCRQGTPPPEPPPSVKKMFSVFLRGQKAVLRAPPRPPRTKSRSPRPSADQEAVPRLPGSSLKTDY